MPGIEAPVRLVTLVAGLLALPLGVTLPAQGTTLEDSLPPGEHFAAAQFRAWIPAGVDRLRATLVLVPGSNGDGRGETTDTVWRNFASRLHLALVGVRLTDKPHPQGFIEEYVNAEWGTGQVLLDALADFARRSGHPELADAPLLLWGMSAGGEYNYEFTAWKPERVIAFVVNKGNIYYHALLSPAARAVPGLLFTGGKDLLFRRQAVAGLFGVNRRSGALWALAEEADVGHVVGGSRDVTLPFFEDVLARRLPEGAAALQPFPDADGWTGNVETGEIVPMSGGRPPAGATSWFPSERAAKAWQAMVHREPPPDPEPAPSDHLPATGTFSIVAWDSASGAWGGAVQSRVFSVGNGVLWAEAGLGVVATQAIVDVSYGPQALALLRQGMPAAEVVKAVWQNDPDPDSVRWSKYGRQFAVVDAQGHAAAYTGPQATEWAGDRQGPHVSVQGNILAGSGVVDSMLAAYQRAEGTFAERLVAALEAGDAAGGDKRGKQSAALLIVKKCGGVWLHNDVVLRLQVDDNPEPIAELRRLVELAPRRGGNVTSARNDTACR